MYFFFALPRWELLIRICSCPLLAVTASLVWFFFLACEEWIGYLNQQGPTIPILPDAGTSVLPVPNDATHCCLRSPYVNGGTSSYLQPGNGCLLILQSITAGQFTVRACQTAEGKGQGVGERYRTFGGVFRGMVCAGYAPVDVQPPQKHVKGVWLKLLPQYHRTSFFFFCCVIAAILGTLVIRTKR